MIVRPVSLANRRRSAFTLLEVLVVVAILVVLAGVSSVFVFRYLENAKIDKARLDMKSLETAYKSAMTMNGNNEPNYPADIIPLLEQGQAGLTDPWDGQYQVRVINSEVGPRPQFFTFTKSGQEVVWPKQ
jgi:general secretion pathway protein G